MSAEIIAMQATKSLYYALGHFAYAVAMADGAVQTDEQDRLQEIVKEEAFKLNFDADVSEIIFHILQSENLNVETTFKWGMDELRKGKQKWTPELQASFVMILERVAAAFPPITAEEQRVIQRFKKESSNI